MKSDYIRFVKLLLAGKVLEQQPKVGDTYSWSCHCRFKYLMSGWHCTYYCPKHQHLQEHPQEKLLQKEAA